MANYLAGFRTSNCCIGLSVLVKPFVHASTWSWLCIPLPRYHVTWFCNILKVRFVFWKIIFVACYFSSVMWKPPLHMNLWIQYSLQRQMTFKPVSYGMQRVAPGPEIWKDMASNKHFCPLLCNNGNGEQKASTFKPNVGVFNLCHCHFSPKTRCLFILSDCWLSSHIFSDSICLANMKWYILSNLIKCMHCWVKQRDTLYAKMLCMIICISQ